MGVEPDDVSPFGESGRLDASEDRDSERFEEKLLARRLGAASSLPRMHQKHPAIGREGGVVGVDGVEAECFIRVEEMHLGSRGFEALDETRVLLRSELPVGLVKVPEVPPRAIRPSPAGG
jgi:hypothetical protein